MSWLLFCLAATACEAEENRNAIGGSWKWQRGEAEMESVNTPNRSSFPYYYGCEGEQFSFYRIPKLLMSSEHFRKLSTDAKLLYGLMLESYNDAAVMIAEFIGGTREGFAAMMNEKARELGCKDT